MAITTKWIAEPRSFSTHNDSMLIVLDSYVELRLYDLKEILLEWITDNHMVIKQITLQDDGLMSGEINPAENEFLLKKKELAVLFLSGGRLPSLHVEIECPKSNFRIDGYQLRPEYVVFDAPDIAIEHDDIGMAEGVEENPDSWLKHPLSANVDNFCHGDKITIICKQKGKQHEMLNVIFHIKRVE